MKYMSYSARKIKSGKITSKTCSTKKQPLDDNSADPSGLPQSRHQPRKSIRDLEKIVIKFVLKKVCFEKTLSRDTF